MTKCAISHHDQLSQQVVCFCSQGGKILWKEPKLFQTSSTKILTFTSFYNIILTFHIHFNKTKTNFQFSQFNWKVWLLQHSVYLPQLWELRAAAPPTPSSGPLDPHLANPGANPDKCIILYKSPTHPIREGSGKWHNDRP